MKLFIAYIIFFVGTMLTSCACGHQDWAGLAGHLIPLFIIYIIVKKTKKENVTIGLRIGTWLLFILASVGLVTNIHNILWSGHSPFFG